MNIYKQSKKFYIFTSIHVICLAYLIYYTIKWSCPFLDILKNHISASSSGYTVVEITSPQFTTSNLWIYTIIRFLMTISALFFLIKRNKISALIFIIMFLPVLFEYSIYLFENFWTYQYLTKELGFSEVFRMIYREVIYTMAIFIIITLSVIPNLIMNKQITLDLKSTIFWLILLGASFFTYFKFNLKF